MRRTSTSVAHFSSGEPSPPFTHSHLDFIPDEESFHDGYYTTHDEDNWADEDADEDDLVSDAEGSVSFAGGTSVPPTPRAHPSPLPLRTTQPLPQHQQYRPARRVPNPAPTVDHQEDPHAYGGYSGHYGRSSFRPGSQQPQAFGYYQPGQMMAYSSNPFSPASAYNSPNYGQDTRGYGGEMAQYHPSHFYAYPQFHQMAHHGMHLDAPGAAAAPPAAPVPPVPPGPSAREKELQDRLAEFEKERQMQELAEREKAIEAEARRKAAEESRHLAEEMERFKQQTKIELDRAREEAARATRDGIAAEAAAAAERERQKAEAVKQAEERVKVMYEEARRADEARKKKEAEDQAKAEAEHQLRLAAALRADAEAKEAAAKKKAEEDAKVKQIQDEAKRKADAEFAAKIQAEKDAAAKAAELEALAKAEKEAYKQKIQEETRAALEAAAKKDRGPFLQFKDALGRKYSFPYRLCTTWPNMEELIKQAFDNVDELAYQVHEGWYDLVGPSQEIILPSVWEKVIEPEWSITMSMWPLDRIQRNARIPPHIAAAMGRGRGMGGPPVPPPMGRGRGGIPGGMMPPDGWAQAHKPPGGVPPGIHVVRESSKDKKKKKAPPAFVGFFGGKPVKKKKK